MQQEQRHEERVDSMIGRCQSGNAGSQNMSWFAAGHQSVLLASIFLQQEDADSSPRQIPILAHLPAALKLLLSHI